jgi:2,3-bisphosphoglycerate-dependent phosphoglycerate mutase
MRRLAPLLLFVIAATSAFGQEATPPYRIGGDVKAPVVISRVEPVYPAEARAHGVSGLVILEAVIDRDGKARDVKILKPLPFGVDQAAVDAVKQWKFSPGTRNGEPVDVLINLTVTFKADGSAGEARVLRTAAQNGMPGGALEGGVLGGGVPPPQRREPLTAGVARPPQQRAPLTTVIVFRHAEKGTSPANDPPLTPQGVQRAESLVRMFANTPITAIYTTPYARTRETAAPLAAAKGLTPIEVPVDATYPSYIVDKVWFGQRGGTFVVVGHSNTTRDVLRALGFGEAKDIPDSEYDNLYIVTLGPFSETRVLPLKY